MDQTLQGHQRAFDPPAIPILASLPRPAASDPLALARRFFLAGVAVTLTAGAAWGAILLLRIAAHGSFTALSIFEVNAHGQAQIYGWVGLFVMGFAYLALPRLLGAPLPSARLAALSFPLMVTGIALRAVTEPFGPGRTAGLALAGAALELAAVALLLTVGLRILIRARARTRTPALYVGAALAWFGLGAVFDLFHLARLLAAPGPEALLRQVATYQLPLRSVQIHGLALMVIFGFTLWAGPALFGTRRLGDPLARRLWVALQLAVAGQVVFFVAFMGSREALWAGALWVADLTLAGAAGVLLWNLGLLRRRRADRGSGVERPAAVTPSGGSLKFLRAAHLWLLLYLAMLVAGPVWGAVTGLGFSHAWHGAMRHAVTVGFVSLTIMGMTARVVPALQGLDPSRLSRLWAPFLLLNAGCALRVFGQVATDLVPAAFRVTAASGLLELAALALWGAHVAGILLRSGRAG